MSAVYRVYVYRLLEFCLRNVKNADARGRQKRARTAGSFSGPRLVFFRKSNRRAAAPSSSPALSQTDLILRRFFDKMGLDAVHSVQPLCSRQSQGSSRLPF